MTDKPRRVDLYPADWIAGLAGRRLGAAAWGVYNAIILIAYDDGRPRLPETEIVERLSALMGDDPRTIRAAIERLVRAAKLVRVDGELEPRKVREQLERAESRVQVARENGTKGGRPRKENNDLKKPGGSTDEKLSSIKHQASSKQAQQESSPPLASTPAAPRLPGDERAFEDRLLELAKLDPARWVGNFGMVRAWRNAGCTDDDILAGISTVADRPGYRPPGSLNYFRQAIEEARDMRRGAEARGEAPPVSPARAADIRADRIAKLTAAHAKAQAAGHKPGDPGFPRAEDFGLVRDPAKGFEILRDWKGPPASQEAAA